MGDVLALAWPADRLGEALEGLVRRAGLASRRPEIVNPTRPREGETGTERWIEAAAEWFGCEAESRRPSQASLQALTRGPEPVLLRVDADGSPRFLALLRGGRRAATLLAPDFSLHRVAAEEVEAAAASRLENDVGASLDAALELARVAPARRARARRAVVREWLGLAPVTEAWVLRPHPGARPWRHARHAGLPGRLAGLVGIEAAYYALFLLSWWLVGRGALEGRLELGWLLAWALLLLTLVPLRLLGNWWQGRIALSAGRLLRQRLLYGTLRLDPEELRHRGAGQLLGSVIESEAVEQLALQGGFAGLVALIELLLAAWVLAAGAGGGLHAALLAAWLLAGGAVFVGYLGRRRDWTTARVSMTDRLVERMVGHRTVLAQEAPHQWANERDLEIEDYLSRSRRLDASMTLFAALLSRGWVIVGLAGLAAPLIDGGASRASLAVGIGGVLLASRSLRRLALSASQLAGAGISWGQVAAFFRAADRPVAAGSPRAEEIDASSRGATLQLSELQYRYPDRDEPALAGCDLGIGPGDRLLVEGPSGGGKSTLAALLLGLRAPQSGLLLLDGLDLQTLGERGWRRRVAGAPQFHENHVMSETLAFNLLMGRRWPPRAEDFEQAEELCRALGLGPLLERMPAGMLQIVGDTGWQLSHGEQSRVFIARALLQDPDLLILDESFGALDPETLRQAMACVRARARGLLVIAHT